jgi:hypothetical protein
MVDDARRSFSAKQQLYVEKKNSSHSFVDSLYDEQCRRNSEIRTYLGLGSLILQSPYTMSQLHIFAYAEALQRGREETIPGTITDDYTVEQDMKLHDIYSVY